MKITKGNTVIHDAPINCLSREVEDGQLSIIAHLRGCRVEIPDDEVRYLESMARNHRRQP